MNVRHLFSFALLAVGLSVPARAVNHNPSGQSGTPESTDVTINSATATDDGQGTVTVTVTVDGGNVPSLLAVTSSTPHLAAYKQDDATELGSGLDITAEGTYSFTFPSLNCGCKVDVKLKGLTDTQGSSTETPPETVAVTPASTGGSGSAGTEGTGAPEGSSGGGDGGAGNINMDSPVGTSQSDGSGLGRGAGSIKLQAGKPGGNLYSAGGLKFAGSAAGVQQIRAGGPSDSSGPLRQMVSGNQFTDIETLPGGGYRISVHDLANKGIQDSVTGIYAVNGVARHTTTVENPGKTIVSGTNDPQLYEKARFAKKLSYVVPVADNRYTVQLYFSESFYPVGKGQFNIAAQGQTVFPNYEPVVAAGGLNKAKEESLLAVVNNGKLNLDFTGLQAVAHVSAIKVTSAGGTVSGTDATLYSTSRFGEFSYQASLPDGAYEVSLYFSEPVYTAAGKRVFDVKAQGATVLDHYDIFTQAGGINLGRKETFSVQVTGGQLNLQFVKIIGEPRVNGIAVKATGTGDVVQSTHAGGGACTADGVAFQPDSGFSGGMVDYPGAPVIALTAGDAYTASDGTVFLSDLAYLGVNNVNGYVVDTSLTRMRVTKQDAGQGARVYTYSFKTDPQTGKFGELALTQPSSLKQENRRVDWSADGQSYDETWTLADDSGNIAKQVVSTYERTAAGMLKVAEKKMIAPGGAALTTTWTYYTGSTNPSDPKPIGYGQAQSMRAPGGYWEQYVYTRMSDYINVLEQVPPQDGGSGDTPPTYVAVETNIRTTTKTISQYLDSAFGDEANSKVDTVTHADSNPVETHVTTIKGQEVARSYVVETTDTAAKEFERKNITCIAPGAAWDDPSNLVSITRTYTHDHANSVLRGQTKWTRLADGTMTIYGYSVSGSTRIVTTDTGAPNSTKTAIIDGTRTVTTTNVAGQTIEQRTVDLASGQTVALWTALTVDDQGRPTEIGYGDGSSKSLTYVGSAASCGTCSNSGNFLVESETDRNGVTTTYVYDTLNRRTDTTRLGVTEHLVYDAADRVVERHRIGVGGSDIRIAKTVYDLAGRVVETYDALNNKTDYAYTYPAEGGMVTTITNPAATTGATRGVRIEATYGDGHAKEISGTAVSPLKYAYGTWTDSGKAGEWTREIKVGDIDPLTSLPAETEWTKTYTDLAHRTVKVEYPDSAVGTMVYNTLGQLTSQTDADGVQTLYAYNTKGERETAAIDMDRDAVIDYQGTTNPYFAGDRITKTIRDVYSRSGTIVSRTTTQVWGTDITNTATTVSVTEQDGYGNSSWQTDAAGAVASTMIARTDTGAWTVTSTAPDSSQQVQTYTGGRLASTTRRDSSGGQVTKTDYAYDAHNRVETQTDARIGNTVYTYTDRDEVHTVTVKNGTEITAYAYDALGNQLTITRPDGSVTTNDYHLRNKQLKKISGSLAYPVEYTYDPQGRMKTLTTWQNAATSAGAAVTTWHYDPLRGWLTSKTYDDGAGPIYTYTNAGRLETRTWARTVSGSALVTTYGYDYAGQLQSTDYSDDTPDVTLTYTRFGAKKSVTDAAGTTTYTYNAYLRADQEQLDASYYDSRILTRSYQTTGAGQVPGRNDGFELGVSGDLDQDYDVIYGYDAAGRLDTVTDPNGTFTYGYVANSELRNSVTGPVHVATTAYEPYRNVITKVENTVGGATVSMFDYMVNSLGQRTQRTNTGSAFGTTSTDVFTYNSKGEVESATNAILSARDQSFVYDDIGNRKSFTTTSGTTGYEANNLNAYTLIGSAIPTYDADGNQRTTGTGQVYTWDAENRLVGIEPALPLTGDLKQVNTYDGQSRRVRKQVYNYTGADWSPTSDEKFIYDGWNLVAKFLWNASTSTLDLGATFTWGTDLSGSLQGAGGVGGLLSVKDGNSVYHYTYDANGNVSEVLNASGGVAAHYEYDAFGNTVVSAGGYAAANPFRFSTKPLDDVGGLYYYGFRYYNPQTGRWLSRDPLEEEGGLNLYGMVNNDPVNYWDYLGQSIGWWECSQRCAAHSLSLLWEGIVAIEALVVSAEALMELPVGTKTRGLHETVWVAGE